MRAGGYVDLPLGVEIAMEVPPALKVMLYFSFNINTKVAIDIMSNLRVVVVVVISITDLSLMLIQMMI